MLESYKQFWKRYVDFEGRTTRKEYWETIVLHHIILGILVLPFFLLFISIWSYTFYFGRRPSHHFFIFGLISWITGFVYILAGSIPIYALAVRRLRDAGIHWGFIFLCIIPYIGSFVMLGYSVLPSKKS